MYETHNGDNPRQPWARWQSATSAIRVVHQPDISQSALPTGLLTAGAQMTHAKAEAWQASLRQCPSQPSCVASLQLLQRSYLSQCLDCGPNKALPLWGCDGVPGTLGVQAFRLGSGPHHAAEWWGIAVPCRGKSPFTGSTIARCAAVHCRAGALACGGA